MKLRIINIDSAYSISISNINTKSYLQPKTNGIEKILENLILRMYNPEYTGENVANVYVSINLCYTYKSTFVEKGVRGVR